jgi:hypothetical protein
MTSAGGAAGPSYHRPTAMHETRLTLAAALGGLEDAAPDALRRLSRMGYAAIHLPITQPGLRPRDLDAVARRGLAALLRRLELSLGGLDLWIPPGDFVDPGRSDRAASAVQAAIELSAELRRLTEGGSAGSRGAGISLLLPSAAGSDDALRTLLGALLASAERHGVDLVDCTHPPQHPGPAGDPHWCVGIDPPAWLAAGGTGFLDPADLAVLAGHAARVRSVRLADLSRSGMRVPIADRACGGAALEARLDPSALAGALSATAPTALPVADPRQWADPWLGLEQTLAVWRRAVQPAW